MTTRESRRREPAASPSPSEGVRTTPILHPMRPEPIRDTGGRVVAGSLADCLLLVRHSRLHLLRLPVPSWAVDVHVLAEAKRRGCTRCEVRDLDTGLHYACRLDDFDEHGRPVEHGHGPQVRLPLGWWAICGAPPVLRDNPAQLRLSLGGAA